jgi:hypothetical protein
MKTISLSLSLAAALLCVAQDLRETGPTSLVIVYKCIPEKRVQLLNYMRQSGIDGFHRRKESGMLVDYRLLFSRYVDTNNWDMMAVLWFTDYAAVQKWKHVERTNPAGLDPSAMANLLSVSSYPVDMVRHAESSETPPEPVYLVVPYVVSTSLAEYLHYVDDDLRPQFEGWIGEGGLSRYSLFVQRYPGGRPWDNLALFEYRSDTDFGEREKLAAKVREKLKMPGDRVQPSVAAKEPVIADELAPAR